MGGESCVADGAYRCWLVCSELATVGRTKPVTEAAVGVNERTQNTKENKGNAGLVAAATLHGERPSSPSLPSSPCITRGCMVQCRKSSEHASCNSPWLGRCIGEICAAAIIVVAGQENLACRSDPPSLCVVRRVSEQRPIDLRVGNSKKKKERAGGTRPTILITLLYCFHILM